MSIFIFVVILLLLILVHELGHFIVAKWVGMRVDEFGIGFPPKLFGKKHGETEYTINALPIGGFVRIYGEDGIQNPDAREGAPGEMQKDTGAFTSKNKWAQAAVLVAGVSMNVLFAWFLVALAFSIGVRSEVSEAEATQNAQLVVTGVLPGSPAEKAALAQGAVVKSVATGEETLDALSPSQFISFVGAHASEEIAVAYTINGELRLARITPEKGIIETDPEKPAIGVSLSQIDTVASPPLEAIGDSFKYVVVGIHDITVGLVSLLVDAITMKADLSQVAGPVGIVGLVEDASSYGFTTLLMFTAFISLNLAVINIFPFPALDGGRLALVFIEAIKGSPLNVRAVGILNTIGFAALILLMVAVTWNDIARLL